MSWSLTAGALLGGGAAAISLSVGIFAWQNRMNRIAYPTVVLFAALGLWSLLYGIQLGFSTPTAHLFWQRLTLGVAAFVPTLWLIFSLEYTNRRYWLTRNRISILLLEPVGFLLLCLSNPIHGLVWSEAHLTGSLVGIIPVLSFEIGYVLHISYAYLLVSIGIGLLLYHVTHVGKAYQQQVAVLILGVSPPFLTHILYTLGVSPIPGLDLTPFVFSFTGIIFVLGLFRYELLKLAPIARTQAINEVGDGLIVLNRQREIVDLFGIAGEILSPTPTIGDSFNSVFPASVDAIDGTELTATIDGRRRVYQIQVSPIEPTPGDNVGTLIILRDITGMRESEQRLSVSDRVLRHNLRNDMTVILGYARELESKLEGDTAEDAKQIRKTVEKVLDLSEKARQINNVHSTEIRQNSTIDVQQEIQWVAKELATRYDAVAVEFAGATHVSIEGIDPETFRLAIRNVLENAMKHNDSENPVVKVTIRQSPHDTEIEFSDNGPGIPEVEQQAIEAGVETQLSHSQGLGLWLTYWCVTMWGGDIHIDSEEAGTTVTITLPHSRIAGTIDEFSGRTYSVGTNP